MKNLLNSLFFVALVVAAFFWAQTSMKDARQEAIAQASQRLALTRDIRIAQLKSEVKTIYSEIRFWADSKPVQEDMGKIIQSWNELSSNPKARARQLYITENPLSPNYKADFYKADDGSSYSENHEIAHKLLKGLTKRRGYYDVFLIANNGDIVYTVFKEDDYATNLLTGKYKESTLAQGFREVKENTNLNHVSLFDFVPYAPSKNAPSSFIQTSIIDVNNKTQGVLAFQLPVEPIEKIIGKIFEAGQEQVLAVGSNYMLRHRINEETIKEPIRSEAIERALKGETGVEQLEDYTGKKTITAYAPFNFSNNRLGNTAENTWAIIAKQEVSAILKPVEKETRKWLYQLAGLVLFSLLLTWLLTRRKEDLSTTEEEDEVI
ncbi:MAG: cache domain-containing protein [Cocleimonas sp.]|nr:cache domain-containing protein [Cocleimonas sp.]